jgi:hypothetical protein
MSASSDEAATRGPWRVITLGIHGSASTWVFNVARELLVARFGAASVHPCHALRADDLRNLPAGPGRHVVAKTHGWPTLPAFAAEWQARAIISVRDPRDAVLSVMQRFGEPFERSLQGIAQDCRAVLACAGAGFPALRYEDRFFEQPATVGAIAAYLRLPVEPSTAAEIFMTYSTDAVRRFAAGMGGLPPERLDGQGSFRFDRLTQITNTHIGDGRVGKWRDQLDPRQQALVTTVLRPFLARFGYDAGGPPG